MGFGEIYWPVACALLTIFIVTEIFHVIMGFWMHKRHERKMKEAEATMRAQGIDPMMAAFLGGAGMGLPPGPPSETSPGVPETGGPELKGGKNDVGGYV
jgi:hypothetical protein